MAEYKHRENLLQTSNAAFDTRHAPGTRPSNPGIYRCRGCGDEIVIPPGAALPTHDHPAEDDRKVEWQLLVHAQRNR